MDFAIIDFTSILLGSADRFAKTTCGRSPFGDVGPR